MSNFNQSENEAFWSERWASGETPWDHGKAAPPLKEFIRKHPIEGRALVPGCGSGHDVRLLRETNANAFGMDLAEGAIKEAKRQYPDLSDFFLQGDFLNPFEKQAGAWDWVIEHTCFCAIHPSLRQAYTEAVKHHLRAGGYFLAIFYLNPVDPGGPPYGSTRDELRNLFADFEILERYVPKEAYASRLGREEVWWMRNGSA